MPTFLDSLQALFGSRDLYAVIGIQRDASPLEVKRGYHRLSLKVHPDRVSAKSEKKKATEKFQALGKVYCILSDAEKRKIYNETGSVDDDDDAIDNDRDWQEYWRLLFPPLTVKDIKDYEAKYRDSAEELEDLKAAYVECNGDLGRILDCVICAREEDADRFFEKLRRCIDNGEIPAKRAFKKLTKKQVDHRKRKMSSEAKEAEEMKTELGLKGTDSGLESLIKARQQNREHQMDSLLDQLAAKYGNGIANSKSSTGKKKTKR